MGIPVKYHLLSVEVGDEDPLKIRDELITTTANRCIFDLDRIICLGQIQVALNRTDRAFQNDKTVANTWGVELLIHLYGDHQIVNAINSIGISENTRRIGIIQEEMVEIPSFAESDFILNELDESRINMLKDLYNLPGVMNICDEIISKGINVVLNHE